MHGRDGQIERQHHVDHFEERGRPRTADGEEGPERESAVGRDVEHPDAALNSCSPRSSNSFPDPETRSPTVRETGILTSAGGAGDRGAQGRTADGTWLTTLYARSRTRSMPPALLAFGSSPARGQDEVRVHHAAFTFDRRMALVQGARAVDGDVADCGWGAATSGSPQEARKKAGWTRARCEPATTPSCPERSSAPVTEIPTVRLQQRVGVPTEAAVLVPRQVGDALDDADGLDQRLDLVAALVPRHVPVAVSEASRRSRSSSRSAAVAGSPRGTTADGPPAVHRRGRRPPRPAVSVVVARRGRRPCRPTPAPSRRS